jgi:hypothetical protein
MRSAKHVQNTYGYRSDVWESAKAEAVLALKAKAKAKDLTTYVELTRQIVSIHFDPHEYNFHHFLGQLSSESDAAGEGMISALIIYKGEDQLPSPGFFDLAKRLGRDISDRVRCWSDEVNRVHLAAA